MKQDILKIAGVKSEAEFYKKFPSEEAFMKVHGKQFKKAKMGTAMVKKQLTQLTDFANPPQAEDGDEIPKYQYSGTPLRSNLQKPSFMQPFDFNATPYQQYQPMGLSGGMSEEFIGGTPSQYRSINLDYSQPMGAQFNPNYGGTRNNATYNNQTGMFNSSTGQVSMADTRDAGFYNSGNKTIKRTLQDLDDNDINNIKSGVEMTSMIGKNVQKIGNAIENKKKAKQLNALAPVITQAAGTRPERIKNKYVRPEDMMFDPNQMFPSYGTGTNVLAANGAMVGGNPTEIQNMYNPGDLYSDLGYEPLNDSGKVKQYKRGGHIPKAQMGVGDMMAIGTEAGNMLGDAAAGIINIGTKRLNKQNEQMLGQAGFQSGMQSLQQNQFGAFMEDGGWVSNDWQPQTITKFGGYDVKDLFREDPMMDTLRAGGHLKSYTNPSEEAMQTYDMGGELSVDDRGDIDFMGYNPETAKTGASGYVGITRGPSHDNGGFNIDYNGNKVEVEGNETVIEKQDGGPVDGESALNILGNMKIGNYGEEIIDDVNKQTLNKLLKGRKIKDVKFKHLGNNIAKKTKSLNKYQEKYVDMADSADDTDLLKLSTAQAGLTGIQMQYKDLNNLQTNLIDLQNIYHDTAKENNYEDTPKFLEDVKKGDLKNQAAMGAKLTKAQFGTSTGKRTNNPLADYLIRGLGPFANLDFQIPTNADFTPQASAATTTSASSNSTKKSSGKSKAPVQQLKDLPTTPYVSPLDSRWNQYLPKGGETIPTPYRSVKDASEGKKKVDAMKSSKEDTVTTTKDKKFDYLRLLRELQPYIIPSNQEPLDPNQLAGEMLALATNQLQPVKSQSYTPQLETPYSVSFQDQLNANQADFNAMQRQLGGNPAALAQLAAQKYAANSGVLGQQFRANQELQMGVQNRNRAALNDSFLKNLAINDQQFQRQEQAKSNTKQQAQMALNSMADKIARHRLENRTLGIQENMYNYRFGPKGRAYNVNAPYEFDTQLASLTADEIQEIADKRREAEKKSGSKTARNGSIVKAIKNL